MDLSALSAQVLSVVTKLAPLSVIIAALALLHNVRQARAKRDRDEAIAVRQILNKLGVKAYLLSWSLVGSAPIAAGALQMRESIEARIGRHPSAADLASFTADQLLFEAVVEKAWRDSKVIERFQSEALEFGTLRADLGNRVPLIQAALRVVDTRLRLLFLLNTFVVFSIRNDQSYKGLAQARQSGQVTDAMAQMHRLLLRAANVPETSAFSEACKLLEEFSQVAASADDHTILRLVRRNRSSVQRLQDWLGEQSGSRRESDEQQELLQKLRDRAPGEFALLKQAVEESMRRIRSERRGVAAIERSRTRMLQAFKGHPGASSLEQAARAFLASQAEHEASDLTSLSSLLRLRSLGVQDPDIDFFLGSITGVTELAKSALDRGADIKASLPVVLARHQALLSEPGSRS
jgi:hypothetical protein